MACDVVLESAKVLLPLVLTGVPYPAVHLREPGVLVAHRGLRCGVTQPGHQFGQRGPGGGSQHRTGVAQIVKPEIGATGGVTGLIELPVQRGRCQVPAVLGCE